MNKEIQEHSDDFMEITKEILHDTECDVKNMKTISVPIAELAVLGVGVSSLIPAFRTITETSTVNGTGLYQIANKTLGDLPKAAKDGTYWGSLKTSSGASKMMKLKDAGMVTQVTQTVMPIDPATVMIAVALASIEQKLDTMIKLEKQILSFLENEKQAEIEADLETLISIISKYKYNWDNEQYIRSNHKMVNDLMRSARANIKFYQKELRGILSTKTPIVSSAVLNSSKNEMMKNLKYYRMAVYTFSLASMLEIMLSQNFNEENMLAAKTETEKEALAYRKLFSSCSNHLEKLYTASLETNILNGIGNIGGFMGKAIGSIPFVKDGPVDEFLIENSKNTKKGVQEEKKKVLKQFSKLSDPKTAVFSNQMDKMNTIFNHTSSICFDQENIYLVNE